MFSIILVFAVLTAGSANLLPDDYPFRNTKIVGGVPVPIEEIPHQVSLQLNGNHFCGGSILDADHIITAGHCSGYLTSSSARVRAGANTTFSGGSLHKIVWVKKHEGYGTAPSGAPMNDIAVAKVDPPFYIDQSRSPITLYYADEDINEGQISVISGWGRTTEGGSLSSSLMAVKVPIVSRKRCSEIYKKYGIAEITEDFICAGTTQGGKDSCQGDSGGPVVVNGQLAGIVSFGIGCARPGIPGVYTNVAYFVKWIAQNTV